IRATPSVRLARSRIVQIQYAFEPGGAAVPHGPVPQKRPDPAPDPLSVVVAAHRSNTGRPEAEMAAVLAIAALARAGSGRARHVRVSGRARRRGQASGLERPGT